MHSPADFDDMSFFGIQFLGNFFQSFPWVCTNYYYAMLLLIEMYHLELLGETINLLGVPPEYRTLTGNQRVYWNASYVYYGNNVCDRLASDIAAELSAIQQYRCHQQLIDDPYIKELLERIIKDEEHHLSLFRSAAARYCPGIK